ncbi:hypothetical protein C8R47DRAFT_1082477 [Mycena vitilis]|nr:hypothetical protein C8R47DRAFT_1082477 [Mycena vitilis]
MFEGVDKKPEAKCLEEWGKLGGRTRRGVGEDGGRKQETWQPLAIKSRHINITFRGGSAGSTHDMHFLCLVSWSARRDADKIPTVTCLRRHATIQEILEYVRIHALLGLSRNVFQDAPRMQIARIQPSQRVIIPELRTRTATALGAISVRTTVPGRQSVSILAPIRDACRKMTTGASPPLEIHAAWLTSRQLSISGAVAVKDFTV